MAACSGHYSLLNANLTVEPIHLLPAPFKTIFISHPLKYTVYFFVNQFIVQLEGFQEFFFHDCEPGAIAQLVIGLFVFIFFNFEWHFYFHALGVFDQNRPRDVKLNETGLPILRILKIIIILLLFVLILLFVLSLETKSCSKQ